MRVQLSCDYLTHFYCIVILTFKYVTYVIFVTTHVLFTGGQMINDAISDQLKNDLLKIEVIAVPILLVLMLFVYGGLTAMIPPIMLSIWTLSLTLTGLNLLASNGFSVTTYVRGLLTVVYDLHPII